VERVGLRLQLRRAQAEAGDVVLLYGDESEALTHPYLAHAWAERGADLRVQAPGQARKVAMLGVLDATTRTALVHTSPTKRSGDFVALLERLDRAYGPVPGQARKPVVLVLDNGPIHTSKATAKALADRPWSGCPGMRPNSTPSKEPGATSSATTSPTAPSATRPTSTGPSIKPSPR